MDISLTDPIHLNMERKWSSCTVHDWYSAMSWQTIRCMWICIITTRPLLYANEVHLSQRSGLAKVRSNCQTRPCWSNMKQDSVTALPFSHLKCFQKYIFVYFLPEKLESLWLVHHLEKIWAKIKHQQLTRAWGVPLCRVEPSVCLCLRCAERFRLAKFIYTSKNTNLVLTCENYHTERNVKYHKHKVYFIAII